MPEVTVLMPVLNGERFLRASIDSVLEQTFDDFELLIVNDGSTDLTREVVESYQDRRIRLINHERNLGLSAALNHGLEAAHGIFVARQDADDLSAPGRLARQRQYLLEHPAVALLGSQASAIDEAGRPLKPIDRSCEHLTIRWYALFDNPFVHTSVMFRRCVAWDRFHGFDSAFDPYSQDYALWIRIMMEHGAANLPERLVTYRVHRRSIIGSLDDAAGTGYAARFETMIRRLVSTQVLEQFGQDGIAAADAELMAMFALGGPGADAARFLAVFEHLLGLYLERHPACRGSADFTSTLARQFDALAFRLVSPSRGDIGRVYRASARHPGVARHMSWSRALALALFGRKGRSYLGRSLPVNMARRGGR